MLILGSTSPRRKEILSFFKIPFTILAPEFDELSVPFDGNPEHYASAVASGKADAISELKLGLPILTADTIVRYESKIFLKPQDHHEAFEMLSFLCGKTHEVITGVCLKDESKTKKMISKTKVTFHDFNKDQILNYIQSIPVLDKSGAYAIQGIGSLIVKKIDGCFYNVMGLPLNTTKELLEGFGFNIWDHLKS